jgi:hypothetical protein
MKPIQREEIVDYVTYVEKRESFRQDVMRQKEERRVHIGEHLTLLFENRDTVRYQIQEMIRAERIVQESDILHEIETYNELLGGPGELGCTLLIEIESREERDILLREWIDLPRHIFLQLADGARIPATYDARQVGEERLSSVQYLKFETGGEVPVSVGTDFPILADETELTETQRAALAKDLKD